MLEVHDVIEQITCSVVRREFCHYEPPRRLIVNNIRVERCGEPVIQPSTNKAVRSLNRRGLSLLLP